MDFKSIIKNSLSTHFVENLWYEYNKVWIDDDEFYFFLKLPKKK